MLELRAAGAIWLGKVRRKARQQWWGDGRNDRGKALATARGLDFEEISAFVGCHRRNTSYRFGGVHRSAIGENALGKPARRDAEPALEIAEALTVAAASSRRPAEAHLRPHPGHRDRLGVAAELRAQQRPPDEIIHFAPRRAPQPATRADLLESFAPWIPLQEQRDHRES